ncbi:TPA: hypothetical protein MNC23_002254 [Citrobacter freundii]|uniref:hypothetical protein n=1 Tax=Citrobacter freundii TaxID=546 RepID=UPI00157696A2|nr:hypothetical protein [Citrobacter freundii]ELR9591898.1 hypothetical protein [Citrobacter freundii]ELZ3593131.1 hypothetical protein [Citrobacter freundii]EMD6923471.1 hypothetical protein [Citrobacter freundii]MBJ8724857.1 hypothetical protein [Citrobacter freundii]
MGKKSLVIGHSMTTSMENSGQFLMKELEKKGVALSAAMWFFYGEMFSWKYILVISDLEEKGPTFVYSLISQINRDNRSNKYHSIPLEAIEAKGESAFIYKMMKGAFSIENSKVRLSNSMVNGLDIVDCLIYKFK